MIVAIVPAAGKSERMGRPKLLLPLGPRRVIEHVLDCLTRSKVDQTFVVVPIGSSELHAAVRAFEVDVVQLAEPTADMRSSIVHGLAHAEKQSQQISPEAVLVALADQPTISPEIVNQLIDQFRSSSKAVFIPTFGGKRGHPVLFAWSLVPQIRSLPSDRGLNHLIAQLAAEVQECPVHSPTLLDDLDTPQDYERLQKLDW